MSSSRDDGDKVDTQNEGSKTLVRFWLEYQGHTLELRNGAVVVGRSSRAVMSCSTMGWCRGGTAAVRGQRQDRSHRRLWQRQRRVPER